MPSREALSEHAVTPSRVDEVGPRTGSDPADPAPVDEALAAVHVGVWVSATRCLLTYVVAPVAGVLGLVLGPVGLLLQVAGAITASHGARRLWPLGHRLRVPYAALAVVIDLVTVLALARWVGTVWSATLA